ncbi:MAG: flagellar basal body P-ring formation chaperone FlgA [Beijerinckiaceae bacterium]
MAMSFARTWLGACALGISLFAAISAGSAARAEEGYVLPVPNITIYPGDTIKDAWLVDRDFSANTVATRGAVIQSRSALVGKLARRTLLPGVPIPVNGIGDPRTVANGGKVRVVFSQDGLEITTYATALQPGSVGEVISVRNLDSGLTISGIVQSDGSVRVGGG